MLIDTHAHLDDERFTEDFPAVLRRAQQAGVERIVTVATTRASSEQCLKLAAENALLAPSVGIHPNHAAEAASGDWDIVVRLSEDPGVVALGETGLDRHWDFTPFPKQEDYFARHLELSRLRKLPVIIHGREADEDIFRMLRHEYDKNGPIAGVMHSFIGSAATAQSCLEMGLYVSFAGMVTYKNAAELRAVAALVPADRLLVETDCPYLAPVPHRGKRNEPAFVAETARCLADVRGVAFEEFAAQTTENARGLFAR
ncbi:MAG TPA: TatD family hydrolase [Gemmataceae bacterium]|jgi:TatD DNase family protein|nr:TatD family hydrolase [Gemmataceae bacterium]